MYEKILDYVQEQYPHPISDTVSGLKRAISSHEKRDRIIEVFRTRESKSCFDSRLARWLCFVYAML